jgi:hypothetical protein
VCSVLKKVAQEMDKQMDKPKTNSGFLQFLLKILSLPLSIYDLLFKKDIRNALSGKVVLITGASSGLGKLKQIWLLLKNSSCT